MSTEPQQAEPAHAGLDALALQAAAVDEKLEAPAGGGPATPTDATTDAPAQVGPEVAGMLQAGVAMLTPLMPFLPECYTPEACARIGVAVAAVAEKRGWNMAEMMTPELALCIVTIPPTIQAVMMGRAYSAAKRAAAEKVEQVEGGRTEQHQPYPMGGQEGMRVMPGMDGLDGMPGIMGGDGMPGMPGLDGGG